MPNDCDCSAAVPAVPTRLISLVVILVLANSSRGNCQCPSFCGQSSRDCDLSNIDRIGRHNDAPVEVAGPFKESHQRQQQQQGRHSSAGLRLKRSPTPRELKLLDKLEALFRAYQTHRQQEDSPHSDRPNFQMETPAPRELDRLSEADERRAPKGNNAPAGTQNHPARHGTSAANDDQPGQQVAPPAKIIETAVFIDQALDNKFTGLSNGLVELNKLVLTIMNQVQYLFEYSSLQVPIKLKLVLVEHLRESERLAGMAAPSPERGDIDAYLSNFCNWQQSRLDSEKRLWWDHAILLSGLDLYKATPGKNHSGVLGLAWVGGMCKGNYSCTINEASNFESAFVIAHEIGHSLGIMHDGQRNKCEPNSYIMSERTGAGKVHWSKCSNGYLNDSIQRGQLKCLDSEQNNQVDSLYDLTKLRAPGQVYTVNEQCRLAFGNNYTSYATQQKPFNAVCRELWCVSGSWAKAAHPALEGSSCGQPELVCREGKCVQVAQ